jgi:hypothetical protein
MTSDIIIKNKEDQTIAMVEVKNSQNLSKEIADNFRRNLIAHGLISNTPYFLILSQDKGFLWNQKSEETKKIYEFSVKKILEKYIPEIDSGNRLKGQQLEFFIFQWLNDLALRHKENITEINTPLASSGFIHDIQDANVVMNEH